MSSMADKPITVAMVEDDAGTRARLAAAIRSNGQLQLLHEAATGDAMLDWLREHQPDVLLVDLGLPDRSGIDVIRRSAQTNPGTEVMVITMFGDEANMIRAFEAGAKGYLLKDGTEDDLAQHVLNLHAGGSPMSPIIARQLLARMTTPPVATPDTEAAPPASADVADRMSPREREILSLLARGYTYPELARLLGISLSTIQTHVKSIYSKLAVHSKTEAVFEARQLGLLDR